MTEPTIQPPAIEELRALRYNVERIEETRAGKKLKRDPMHTHELLVRFHQETVAMAEALDEAPSGEWIAEDRRTRLRKALTASVRWVGAGYAADRYVISQRTAFMAPTWEQLAAQARTSGPLFDAPTDRDSGRPPADLSDPTIAAQTPSMATDDGVLTFAERYGLPLRSGGIPVDELRAHARGAGIVLDLLEGLREDEYSIRVTGKSPHVDAVLNRRYSAPQWTGRIRRDGLSTREQFWLEAELSDRGRHPRQPSLVYEAAVGAPEGVQTLRWFAPEDRDFGATELPPQVLVARRMVSEIVNLNLSAIPQAMGWSLSQDEVRPSATDFSPVYVVRHSLQAIYPALLELALAGSNVQQCARKECLSAFVPRHGRRKYCSDQCGARVRQSRFRAKQARA